MDKTTYDKRKYTIEKTQGTKNSMGSFMVFDENGEEIWDSKTNSNAWDTYQEALQVKERLVMDKKIMKTRVISSREDWIRMDREEAARKECELNKDKPLFDTELKINLFRIGGFKNE